MGEFSMLLERAGRGDAAAWQLVEGLLYDDLQSFAAADFAAAPEQLDSAAVMQACYRRVAERCAQTLGNRNHFLALAGRAMRQMLVTHARNRTLMQRRRTPTHTVLGEIENTADQESLQLLELNAALERLECSDARLVQVVDCRMFAALTEEETADAMQLTLPVVRELWRAACACLRNVLSSDGARRASDEH